MIQYKLIQEYPGSPKLGTIDWYKNDNGFLSSSNEWKGMVFYDANPTYWQKVEEVDYEIISYVTDISNPQSKLQIYSVKRKSDGEVFTVGDEIKGYKNTGIKEIILYNYGLRIITDANGDGCSTDKLAWKLENCIKTKTPLFTTEDGVKFFKGDKFSAVQLNSFQQVDGCRYTLDYPANWRCFSTPQKAEEYILLNKPCLSLNDISTELNSGSLLFKKIKELAKSKL